jgi:hypothetical protein
MNITLTYEEWLQNYLKTYHKPPYTKSKIEEAERVWALRIKTKENT